MRLSGPLDTSELTRKTAGTALWLIVTRLVTKAIDFIVLLILARLLNPADFGIVAIAMTSVTIIEAVFEIPVYQVLIAQDVITNEQLDTGFTLGMLRGFSMSLVLLAIAVPFSYFYHEPRLIGLIVTLSLAPGMRGIGSPRLVEYAKRLDYSKELIAEIFSKSVALILTVAAAWFFHDYHALIVCILSAPTAWVCISYVLVPYQPKLSLKSWPLFAHFMSWTTAAQFLSALNWQCDRLILGRTVSPAELGAFSLANDLSFIPEQALVRPIVRPLVSTFVLIREDPDRLASAYHKIANTLLAIGTPVLVGLSLLADPAVHFALGSKWIVAIPIVQWLALTLIPPLLTAPFSSLALATKRPHAVLWQTAAEALTKLPMMIVGVALMHIEGAIFARAISSFVTALMILFFVRKILGTSVLHQLKTTWRTVAGACVLALVLWLLRPELQNATGFALGVDLLGLGLVGLASYGLTLCSLWLLTGRPEGIERTIFNRIVFPLMNKVKLWKL